MILMLATSFAQSTPALPANVNAQNYRSPLDSERTLWADDAGHVLKGGKFKARGMIHYAHNPFVFYPANNGDRTKIVSDVLQLDAMAMYQYNRFRLGVTVPIYLYSAGQLTDDGAGIGDLSLDARATLLDRTKSAIGAAVGGRLTVPTSSVQAPLGYGGVGGEFFGIIDSEIEAFLITANIGVRFFDENELINVKLNDQAFARFAMGYQIVEDAGVSLDFNGNLNLGGDPGNIAGIPVEGLLGGWGRVNDFVIRGGVGTGLTPGIGSADFRGLLGFGYEPSVKNDPDGDGLIGDEDKCPNDPEDFDQFEDLDGCPDPDNDNDGVLDVDDQCINDPEDIDQYKDDDGCPDLTTQVTVKVQRQNGLPVPDVNTSIKGEGTDEPGTSNFVVDLHEGSYSVSATAPEFIANQLDFTVPLPDGQDEVVLILMPDVIMGDLTIKVQDEDGIVLPDPIWYMDGGVGPAPINDGQAVVTVPAGDHSLDVRHEGYVTDRRSITVPEKGAKVVVIKLKKSNVTVSTERIDIKDTVYFNTAKATIQSRSFDLLDDVAGILLDHPELTKVRIEGHTDSRGSASYNKRLSDQRAKSVRAYLIGKGVAEDRLEAIGYGEEKPIDPANNEAAWEKNRRVDFFIVERSD